MGRLSKKVLYGHHLPYFVMDVCFRLRCIERNASLVPDDRPIVSECLVAIYRKREEMRYDDNVSTQNEESKQQNTTKEIAKNI